MGGNSFSEQRESRRDFHSTTHRSLHADVDVAVARSEVTLSSPLTSPSMHDFSHPYAMTGEVTLYLLLIASDERSEPCVFERETRSPIEDDDDSDTGKKIRDTTFEDFSVPYGTAEMRVVYSSET